MLPAHQVAQEQRLALQHSCPHLFHEERADRLPPAMGERVWRIERTCWKCGFHCVHDVVDDPR